MTHPTDPFLGNRDGAGPQAVAVLAYIAEHSGIEPSYSSEQHRYLAEPRTDRWHNGREQGYVISMTAPAYTGKQINIAFFEHRNSDEIHALVFMAKTYGEPPTMARVPEDVYRDKHDTTHRVSHGKAADMAEWIVEQLTAFWVTETQKTAA